jgi:hypothetical protein
MDSWKLDPRAKGMDIDDCVTMSVLTDIGVFNLPSDLVDDIRGGMQTPAGRYCFQTYVNDVYTHNGVMESTA